MKSKKQHNPPRSLRRTGLSAGGLALLLLVVLLQWWNDGAIIAPTTAELTQVAARPHMVVDGQEQTANHAATSIPDAADTRQEGQQGGGAPDATPGRTQDPTPIQTAAPQTAISDLASKQSDLPAIHYEQLPPEAKETIMLIEQGGPFPFERDGLVFQNREQLLPRRSTGYYHEYTVITPGEDDRGARRIVAGEDGEMYYTDDHYASFREILR